MEKDIGKISKGEYQGTTTNIVVGIKEYNGRVGVDIREFAESEKYSGPTKKGLRIPAEHFEKFKEMINSISEDDLKVDEPIQEEIPKEQSTLTESTTEPAEEANSEDLPDY